MLKADKIRELLNLPSDYPSDKLASLCILYGISKEDLEQDYLSLDPISQDMEHLKNFKQLVKNQRNSNPVLQKLKNIL